MADRLQLAGSKIDSGKVTQRSPMATYPVTEKAPYGSSRRDARVRPIVQHEPLVSDMLDEHHFVRMLRLERKRCERSGESFMLMLFEAPELFQATTGMFLAREISRAISASTRETDILGWYEQGSVLGLIVNEIGLSACSNATLVATRVSLALQETLSPEVLADLKLRVRIFPEESDDERGDGREFTFYRDLSRSHDTRRSARGIKRLIDIIGSVIALIGLSPIMLLIAFLVKCTSSGPVLFRQRRVGRYGVAFTFLKFRSMYANNDPKIHQEYVARLIAGNVEPTAGDSAAKPTYKLVNDPRITRLGRFLRKSSLDELPQLINVLRGEMSLVGPRPPVPYEFERYDTWHKRRVFEVKPGITGLWQVKGRSKTTFDEMVRLDLRYIRTWTPCLDLKIILQTPRAVLSADGAY
jgi:lipopolysaccharide/colanic/teichoic acid biosynthesis glycosyltransferase